MGGPLTDPEIRFIVLKITEENPLWDVPRIYRKSHSEWTGERCIDRLVVLHAQLILDVSAKPHNRVGGVGRSLSITIIR